MINTENLWNYIKKHSVRCYEHYLKSHCVDTEFRPELEHYNRKEGQAPKLEYVNLWMHNKPLLDINRGMALKGGNPAFYIERDNPYHNYSYIDKENMYLTSYSVDFKYWKDSGTIDIVVNRNGLTDRWVDGETKWYWRKLQKTLKIKKDNVYIIQGKRIRLAMFQDIDDMLFTIHGSHPEVHFDEYTYKDYKAHQRLQQKVTKIEEKLYTEIYGAKREKRFWIDNPFSVAKIRRDKLYSQEKISNAIHPFLNSEIAKEVMNEFDNNTSIKKLFAKYFTRDILDIIRTAHEVAYGAKFKDYIKYFWRNEYVWESNGDGTRSKKITGCSDMLDATPSTVLGSTDIEQIIQPKHFTEPFYEKGEKIKLKKPRKIGFGSNITQENCHLYGLKYERVLTLNEIELRDKDFHF